MQEYAGRVFDRDTLYDSDSGGILNLPVPGTAGTEMFGDEGLDLSMFGEDGILFDPSSPLDYITLGLAASGIGIPAAIGIKALTTGNKIKKATSKAGNLLDRTFIPRDAKRLTIPKDLATVKDRAKNYGRFVATEEAVGIPSTVMAIKALKETIEEGKRKALEDRGEAIITPKKDGRFIKEIESFGIGGAATKQTAKKILKESDKKGKPKKTDTPEVDSIDEGAGTGVETEAATKSVFGRYPKATTTAAGLATLTGLSLAFGGDDDEEEKVSGLEVSKLDMKRLAMPIVEDEPDTVGEFMREVLINDYGYERNAQGGVGAKINKETGDTIREKPSFGEYVKSFGKAYGQRVASDPEFAKKMLSGFASMMAPREGFAPLSPLGIPEFTAGYLSQDATIEANKGATQKLLESIQDNPELKKLYVSGKLADAGISLNQLNPEVALEIIQTTKSEEADIKGVNASDIILVRKDNDGLYRVVTTKTLLSRANQGADFLDDIQAVTKEELKKLNTQ